MSKQMSMFPEPEPSKPALTLRTYIYLSPDSKNSIHVNAGYGFVGQEYEHDDPNWQPEEDWPYEIIDQRKPTK